MVIITVDAGGSRAGSKMLPLFVEFNKTLRNHCQYEYSDTVQEFSIVWRVSGEITDFQFEGCDRLRRNRKKGYITVDAGIPKQAWQEKSELELKRYLIDLVKNALALFVARLKKDKEEIKEDNLYRDYQKAADEFISNEDSIEITIAKCRNI